MRVKRAGIGKMSWKMDIECTNPNCRAILVVEKKYLFTMGAYDDSTCDLSTFGGMRTSKVRTVCFQCSECHRTVQTDFNEQCFFNLPTKEKWEEEEKKRIEAMPYIDDSIRSGDDL